MYGQDVLQTFNLYDQNALDDQVETISTVKVDPFVPNRKRDLPLESNSAQMQLVAEAFFVRRLQEPRAKIAVDLYCATDDTFSEFFMKKLAPCLRVSVVNHLD